MDLTEPANSTSGKMTFQIELEKNGNYTIKEWNDPN